VANLLDSTNQRKVANTHLPQVLAGNGISTICHQLPQFVLGGELFIVLASATHDALCREIDITIIQWTDVMPDKIQHSKEANS